jgi:hypothetical protein
LRDWVVLMGCITIMDTQSIPSLFFSSMPCSPQEGVFFFQFQPNHFGFGFGFFSYPSLKLIQVNPGKPSPLIFGQEMILGYPISCITQQLSIFFTEVMDAPQVSSYFGKESPGASVLVYFDFPSLFRFHSLLSFRGPDRGVMDTLSLGSIHLWWWLKTPSKQCMHGN